MSDLSLRCRRWYRIPALVHLSPSHCLSLCLLCSNRLFSLPSPVFSERSLTPGRLISPCRCRGTMKFVHLHCLNSWRYASPNRRSVYQCDQCGYKYHFNRTHYAAIASSIYTRVCPSPQIRVSCISSSITLPNSTNYFALSFMP